MKQSLLVAALLAVALTACGKKKEEAAPGAEASAPAVASAPAASAPAASAPAASAPAASAAK